MKLLDLYLNASSSHDELDRTQASPGTLPGTVCNTQQMQPIHRGITRLSLLSVLSVTQRSRSSRSCPRDHQCINRTPFPPLAPCLRRLTLQTSPVVWNSSARGRANLFERFHVCPLLFREKMLPSSRAGPIDSPTERPVYRYIFSCPGQAQAMVRLSCCMLFVLFGVVPSLESGLNGLVASRN